jgi:hypothetical protein
MSEAPEHELAELRGMLGALPPIDARAEARERTLAVGKDALTSSRGRPPWALAAVRVWSRVVVPVALACTVGVYLHWAIETASTLAR